MDDLAKIRREMAGLKREFAEFWRQFRTLQAEFNERAEAIHANWEQADRLMWTHMRDMEEFRNSQEKRLARQRENEREESGKVEDANH